MPGNESLIKVSAYYHFKAYPDKVFAKNFNYTYPKIVTRYSR